MEYKFSFSESSSLIIDKPVFLNDKYVRNDKSLFILIYKDKVQVSETAISIKKKIGLKVGQLLYEPFPIFDEAMINALMYFLKKSKCVDFLIATPNYIPFKYTPKGSVYCPFGSYRIYLNIDEKCLFENMHKRVRQYIRKSEKEKFEILTNTKSLQDGYSIVKKTLNKAGILVKSYEEINALYQDKLLYSWTVYNNNEPQSTLFVIYNLHGAYTLYTGTIKGAFPGISNYVYWKALTDMKTMGVHFFDFSGARLSPLSGSKLHNIQKFKERLGGVMYEGYMWKMIFNPAKYNVYIYLLRIYLMIKGIKLKQDIIDQESQKLEV